MKIGIVNDLGMAVETLSRAVRSVPGYQIIWTARDGQQAVELCAKETPDLILMDLIMPVMDGAEATRRIMTATPCQILIVTSSIETNYKLVFEAMGHGARDAVNTPTGADYADLLVKIELVGRLAKAHAERAPTRVLKAAVLPGVQTYPMLILGASTGGPKALATVVEKLPANFEAAVVIIQHVDASFAKEFAKWLSQYAVLPVRTAEEGETPQAGQIVVANSNDHLVLSHDQTLHYTPIPRETPYRPSVDAFFKSAVQFWPEKGAAALFTGMGRDGAAGLKDLLMDGWYTIAQDQATSVLYGMPKAAAEMGSAKDILPIDMIAPALLNFFQHRGRSGPTRMMPLKSNLITVKSSITPPLSGSHYGQQLPSTPTPSLSGSHFGQSLPTTPTPSLTGSHYNQPLPSTPTPPPNKISSRFPPLNLPKAPTPPPKPPAPPPEKPKQNDKEKSP